ncbi:MAG: UvrD-helicase domain-containing protein [Pirellulales bacterium]
MSDGLNPAQREAVHTLSGPLLVLAGAGTGKTRVVTFRIAQLIRSGIKPERILAVTFTNKAADEMQKRAGDLLGRRRKTKPVISTFHSLCVRILRRHIEKLGYPDRFSIYDRGDQEGLARTALAEISAPRESLRPSDLLYQISSWKCRSIDPREAKAVAETDRQHLAAVAFRRYQQSLKAQGAVDFDDLLLLTEELLVRFDQVRHDEAGRFDHVSIDEYQDTNGSQYRIVRALAAGHRNLCVVGDDDQSIYGWRGAEVEHILRFKIDWPDAAVVRLEENYRSRPEILEMANELIAFNRHRHDKQLHSARQRDRPPRILQFQDEDAEARSVVEDIASLLKHPRVQPRQFAILFRTNEQPRPFETELRRVGLPYVLIGGMSFYDRREVRDVLAYLKLAAFPQDEMALRRIINTPARGISDRTVGALASTTADRGQTLWQVLEDPHGIPDITPAARSAIEEFVRLIKSFSARFAKSKSMAQTAESLIAAVDYRAELERRYPDPIDQESRWTAIEQIVNAIASYQQQTRQPSLADFLDATLLDQRSDSDKDSQLGHNAIALMTLHAAKGLEFPHVYLVGIEEGLLPHRRSVESGETSDIEEERRLCYVGITRAQDRLTVSLALTRRKWGKPRDALPSRFLYEMTGQADHPNAVVARSGKKPPTPRQRSAGNPPKKRRGRKAARK